MDGQHVQEIFNASPFGFAHHEIILDEHDEPVDYRFIEVNPAFESITGLTAESVVGKTVREVIPGIETADFDWIGFYGAVALNGGNESFEQYFELLQKWYRVHVYSGRSGCFTTTFIDVTSEKISQTAIESSVSGVAFADSQGNVFYVNDTFVKMFGYETPDECYGKTPYDAHPAAEFHKVTDALEHIAKNGSFQGELSAKRKNGELFDVQFSASTMKNPRGEQLYVMTSFEEITDRKRSEEATKSALALLNATMESTADGLLVVNSNREIARYNTQFAEMWRIPEEILARGDDAAAIDHVLSQLVDPQQFLDKVTHLYAHPEESSFDQLWFTDGRVFEQYSQPLTISNEIAGRVWSFRDITDRVQAETQMTAFAAVVENSDNIVVVKDLDLRIVATNMAFARAAGRSSVDETIGKTDAEVFGISPEVEPVKTYMDDERRAQALSPGEHITREEDVIGPDGQVLTVLTKKYPIYDKNQQLIGTGNISTDITERKLAEKELNNALEMQALLMKIASDYINIPKERVDESINDSLKELGEFVSADRAYIFEYDWERNVTTNTFEWCADGIDPQIEHLQNDPVDLLPEWVTAHTRGEEVYIHDLMRLPPDNRVRRKLEPQGIKSVLTLPLMNRDQCIGFVGFDYVTTTHDYSETEKNLLRLFAEMLVNVSNRIELEKDLVQSKEQAEMASLAKSQFVANMSHEIRTPLNGVIGFSELLRHTPLTPVQKQYVDSAHVSGQTLLGIINDILDFSKIEAGTLELESVKTDMIDLLGNSVDIVKHAAAENGLELLLNIDPHMPRFAHVDPVRLTQILANLLGNAVKFTARGEVELKAVYENHDDERGKLSLSVRDTGIGISDEEKTKLFKAFSQADSSTTRKFGGTGLGLVISNMIARKMGGEITMTSSPGEGSTFYFDLITNFETGEPRDPTRITSVTRCLIVDDNANNRVILQNMLSLWNIESESCSSGHEGIARLETSADFDLIVCDYNMPGIDGLETVRVMREKLGLTPEKQPVILLLSSSDDPEIHRKAEEMGVRFKLTKPVKRGDLLTYLCDLQEAGPRPVAPNYEPENPETEKIPSVRKARILVAEDNRVNMKLIKIMIRKMLSESDVYEAETGLQAVEQYQIVEPNIVFMDVQMPELNGLDATAQIRALESATGIHVPIIALTAGALKEEREKCFAAGMDDFITKPIDPKKMKTILRNMHR